jgi:prepilin-type processing-associated H-X9-DG protein
MGLVSTLLEAEPVDDAVLASAPKSATWVAATRLDVGGLISGVRAGVAGVVPEGAKQVDEALAQINRVLGLDVQKDLIGTLGDQWMAFNSAETGRGILGMVLVHPLKDAAKFEQSMTSLEKKANDAIKEEIGEDGPELSIETAQLGGVTVHYLAAPAVSPCWAVKNGKLYAAVFPQILVAAMEYDAGAAGAANSILANEDFRGMKKRLGVEKPISVSYMDLPKLAPRGYQMVLAAQRTALGFADLFGLQTPAMALPPLNKIQPHLSPSMGLTWTDEAGWHYRGVTPFPGADVLGGEQALAATAAPLAAAVALPALGKARMQARLQASMSNLRQIGVGVHMYANDNGGALPPDLGATLKYTNSPQVYVVPDKREMIMMAPANMKPEEQAKWVNEHTDYEYLGAGLMFRTIPNAPQRIIAHEKFETSQNGLVNVLFADGHVEVQPIAFAQQQIEQQKKQAQ